MNFYLVEILLMEVEFMKNKLLKLIEKGGFLLFLFICVCVLAFGTIIISNQNLSKHGGKDNEELVILDDPKNSDLSADLDIDGIPIDYDLDFRDKNLGENHQDTNSEQVFKEKEEYEEEIDEIKEVYVELEFIDDYVEASKSQVAILPVQGEVITEFTTDTLIYCETLEEWRAHLGIDIKSSTGTKVMAPLDGTIKELYEDDLWGIVMIIDHGNNLETKLANLGTMEMVKVGLKVKQGDHISIVGKSANIEMLMDDHIHYEARKNGEIVDPRSINQ